MPIVIVFSVPALSFATAPALIAASAPPENGVDAFS